MFVAFSDNWHVQDVLRDLVTATPDDGLDLPAALDRRAAP
jgi:hypothetical protein